MRDVQPSGRRQQRSSSACTHVHPPKKIPGLGGAVFGTHAVARTGEGEEMILKRAVASHTRSTTITTTSYAPIDEWWDRRAMRGGPRRWPGRSGARSTPRHDGPPLRIRQALRRMRECFCLCRIPSSCMSGGWEPSGTVQPSQIVQRIQRRSIRGMTRRGGEANANTGQRVVARHMTALLRSKMPARRRTRDTASTRHGSDNEGSHINEMKGVSIT